VTPNPPDPIADYLHRLARRVRGRVGGERLLDEIGDHLDDTRAELVAQGLGPHEAAAAAVTRLGAAGAVARALPATHHRMIGASKQVGLALAAIGAAGLLAVASAGGAPWVALLQVTGGFVGVTLLEWLRRSGAPSSPAGRTATIVFVGLAAVTAVAAVTLGAAGQSQLWPAAVWTATAFAGVAAYQAIRAPWSRYAGQSPAFDHGG